MLNLRLALLKDLTNSFDGETIEYKRFYVNLCIKKEDFKTRNGTKTKGVLCRSYAI